MNMVVTLYSIQWRSKSCAAAIGCDIAPEDVRLWLAYYDGLGHAGRDHDDGDHELRDDGDHDGDHGRRRSSRILVSGSPLYY